MCLRKNCSPVQVECLHCKGMFCCKHVQCEIHACPSLLIKVPIKITGTEPPRKVAKI